jgi:hypothetical protein
MVFELVKWQRVIRERGVWGAVKSFWQFSDIKQGRLVGTDKFGNKYYENLKDEPILGTYLQYHSPKRTRLLTFKFCAV